MVVSYGQVRQTLLFEGSQVAHEEWHWVQVYKFAFKVKRSKHSVQLDTAMGLHFEQPSAHLTTWDEAVKV